MLPQEAFKIGFLARCVEEGLSPEQTHNLAKQAADCFNKQAEGSSLIPFGSFISNPFKATTDTAKSTIDLAKSTVPLAMMALAAPPAIGGLAAYMSNKATDVDDAAAVEDVKKQELIDTYRRMAQQLNRKQQLRQYKQDRKRTGRVYL